MRASGYQKELLGGQEVDGLEGGNEDWNPYDYCQHPGMVPRKNFEMKPDNRIITLYKKQIWVDFIFIRFILIAGNVFLILGTFVNMTPFQLFI